MKLNLSNAGTRHMKPIAKWIFLFLCTVSLLQGCFLRPQPKVIRVGITPFAGYSFIYLAAQKGYLNTQDARFELVILPSLADVRKAFERGQIDVFAGTGIELLNTRMLTAKTAQAFFAMDYSKGADMLLAQEDIPDIKALAGKRIAFEAQTVDMMMVYHALTSAGLQLSDIQPVPMAQLEIPEAFLTKKIDAAEVYSPASDRIMAAGKYRKIFDSSRVPFAVIDVLIAEDFFIQNNVKALAQLVLAYKKARQEAADDDPRDMKTISDYMGVQVSSFAELVNGLEIINAKDQKDLLKQGGEVFKNLELSRSIFTKQGLLNQRDEVIEWATPEVMEAAFSYETRS